MSVIPRLPSALLPEEVFYPDGDGKPMAETPVHVLLMLSVIGMLREYFRSGGVTYVIGNIFLYYEEGNPEAKRSPDVMVVKGVDPNRKRRSFKTWEEGALPCVVIELTSEATAEEDLGPKKEIYEKLRVREYFLFDPLGEYLERPLIGYRLIKTARNGNGVEDLSQIEIEERYEELPRTASGAIHSTELGLTLHPDGEELRLINPKTGKALTTPSDAYLRLLEAEMLLKEKDEELQEKGAQIEQKDALIEQKDALIEQKDALIEQKDALIEEQTQEIARLQRLLSGQQPPPEET